MQISISRYPDALACHQQLFAGNQYDWVAFVPDECEAYPFVRRDEWNRDTARMEHPMERRWRDVRSFEVEGGFVLAGEVIPCALD